MAGSVRPKERYSTEIVLKAFRGKLQMLDGPKDGEQPRTDEVDDPRSGADYAASASTADRRSYYRLPVTGQDARPRKN
jgi:hypothetical protein